MKTLDTYADALMAHYESVWGPAEAVIQRTDGASAELPASFKVARFEREPGVKAYATICMSLPKDSERLELHMLSAPHPDADPSISFLLSAAAHFHQTGARLGLGHTLNFGIPWLPGSSCTYGLVSLPYLDGPKLEWLQKPKVRCLWLIPITESEREFKRTKGLEALEERFDSQGFEYLNPLRASVC